MDASLVRARLSLSLVATFIGLLTVLHFLEPEFNSGHPISKCQLGRFGWTMPLAFCSFGIGAMLLAQVIRPHLSIRRGQWVPWGVWLIGAALIAAGLCPPIATRPLIAYVHGLSGLVVILVSPLVFLLASRTPVATCDGRPRWRGSASSCSWVPRPSSPAVVQETQLWVFTQPAPSATGS